MIQIAQTPIAPLGVPSNETPGMTETGAAPDAAQPDPWAGTLLTHSADPLARFNALFGAPPRGQSLFYADKNGPSGGQTSAKQAPAGSTASIGGAKPRTLYVGSNGPAVRTLQQELNKWRAAQSPRQDPIAEDGRFTLQTKKAVEEFQKALRLQTGTTKADYTPTGVAEVRVQNRLRLENDPLFTKFSYEEKEAARNVLRRADLDGAWSEPLFTLLKDPSFAKLGEDARQSMLSSLADFPRYREVGEFTNTQLVQEFSKLAASAEFRKLDPRVQAAVVYSVASSAMTKSKYGEDLSAKIRTEIDNVTKLATSPALAKLPADEQKLLMRNVWSSKGDTKLADAIGALIRSPKFDSLKPDEKTAVVSQVDNYPDHRSVANLERLLKKDWFRTQDLDDKQRSLKTIAYLSQHDKGHRATIDNTLDKLLGAGSKITLEWEDFSQRFEWGDEESRTFGEAQHDSNTLILNSLKMAADNKEVPNNFDGNHLVLHTVAHEVNHLVNKDSGLKGTYHHFETEYRAWSVGFKAEHGHWPTNKEVMVRVRQLLTAKDGAYADIKNAGRKYHDAMALFTLLQKITGREVTAGNLDEILRSNSSTWINRSRDPDEQGMKQGARMAPIVDGSLDNG